MIPSRLNFFTMRSARSFAMERKPVPSLLNDICSTLKYTVPEFYYLWFETDFQRAFVCMYRYGCSVSTMTSLWFSTQR
jgi:hypothetical protein